MTNELPDLVRMFETAEEASIDARQEAEQARDYYDGRQITAEERKILNRRKQPIVWDNAIRRKIDYLRGLERQGRTDPKAYPRTMQHEDEANAITDALRYVAADQSIDIKISQTFENMLIEGFGGVEVIAQQAKGAVDPKVLFVPWDRIFYDPHSSTLDFSDAQFLGFVTWMDADTARRRWRDKADIVDSTMSRPYSVASETYDDKPKWASWADTKRKRVRVVTMYYKRDVWMRCVYTLAGMLEDAAPSPFLDEDGQPENALILQSAYCDRDNDRYGIVRDWIPLQDEINKRRSKALHLVTMRQSRISRGAGVSKEEVRAELVKPDGTIYADRDEFEILPTGDMAAAQFQLLAEAKAAIEGQGPNATMQGKGSQDSSGRAILALQQGGMVEISPLIDARRHFVLRLYRQVWNRIRQYWTEERWLRVTDDERNVRFVAVNTTKGSLAARKIGEAVKAGEIDEAMARQYVGQIANDPAMMEPANSVAELDVDIDIAEVNETPTLQIEQFQALTAMAQAGLPIPPAVLIEASNLRNKDKLLKMLDDAASQPDPMQQQMRALQMDAAQAKTDETKSRTMLNMAKADAAIAPQFAPPI